MTRTVKTILGTFTFQQAQEFCSLHNDARLDHKRTFMFNGKPVEIEFAKYMVDFLGG